MLVPSLRGHTRPKSVTAELDIVALELLQMSASVADTIIATHLCAQILGHIGQHSETFTAVTICRGAGDLQNLIRPDFVVFPPHL
jgi:hypothetical protein